MLVSIIILFEIITGIRSGRKKVKKDTKETIYDGRLKIWQMAVYLCGSCHSSPGKAVFDHAAAGADLSQ